MNKQQAIDAHCRDCNFDPLDTGSWRKQISECNQPECNLYPFRPLDQQHAAIKKQDKIANMDEAQLKKYKEKQDAFRARLNRSKENE